MFLWFRCEVQCKVILLEAWLWYFFTSAFDWAANGTIIERGDVNNVSLRWWWIEYCSWNLNMKYEWKIKYIHVLKEIIITMWTGNFTTCKLMQVKEKGCRSKRHYHSETQSSQKMWLQLSRIGICNFSWQIAHRSPAATTCISSHIMVLQHPCKPSLGFFA